MPPEGELSTQAGVTGVDAKSSDSFVSKIGNKEVQVDDKLYNATSLASIHPGGQVFVRAFAGSDATEAFMSYHRRQFPHSKYAGLLVGSTKARKTLEDDKDYWELCREIQKVLPTHQSFAPWHYFAKVAVILGVAVYLEYYMHVNKAYTLALSSLIGWVYALVGLNIQHDANHGAISRYGLVNRVLGLTQNWIGGSAIDWIHQHVVQHHVNTNDVDHDPDMLGSDVLRINPTKERYTGQAYQHLYVFFLLTLFGINYIFSSLVHLLKGQHLKHMSALLGRHRLFDMCTWVFFMARWAVYPVYQTGSYMPLLTTLPMYCVGGFYLSFFFIISHNFVGADMLDSKDVSNPKSFLYKQAATSSNVGGAFLCFINGGLNYQIEHHLFPRISHTHYPTIAPFVRDFCSKKNIPYVHFPTVTANMGSCCQHLYNMGNNDECTYNAKKTQ